MSIQAKEENTIPNNKDNQNDNKQWHDAQGRVFSYLGFITLMFTTISLIVGSLAELVFPYISKSLPPLLSHAMVTTFIPLYVVTVPFIYWKLRRKETRPLEKKHLSASFYIQVVIVSFGTVYVGNYLSLGLASLLARFGLPSVNPLEALLGSINMWEAAFYTVIAAPIAEELIFRKGMMSLLLPYGEKTAIFVSALFFALVHGNLYQLIYAFGLGCVLGYLYVKSGRLRDVIAVHALVNFTGGVFPLVLMKQIDDQFLDRMETFSQMMEQAPKESLELLMDNILPLLGLLFLSFLTIFSIVGAVIILLRNRKKIQLERGETPLKKGHRFKTIFSNPGVMISILFYFVLIAVRIIWKF